MLGFIKENDFIKCKSELSQETQSYLNLANIYANIVLEETFVYFMDILTDLHRDNMSEYLRLVFPTFFVNRFGADKLLKRIDAIRDAINSSTYFNYSLKPVDQLIVYCVVENFREDFEEEIKRLNEDTDKALIRFSSEFCRKNDLLEKIVNELTYSYIINKNDDVIRLTYYICCELLISECEYIFEDQDFDPDFLDDVVGIYILDGGNPDGYVFSFDIDLYEYTDCMRDLTLENFEKCQSKYKFIRDEIEESGDNFSERVVLENIYKAIVSTQENSIYYGKNEDIITDGIRDQLNMVYEVRDQSRCGMSTKGINAGEVDLELMNNGIPVVKIEAMKTNCVNKSVIKSHTDKLLCNYDKVGCLFSFLLIYYNNDNIGRFWNGLTDYFENEYDYPYEFIKIKTEINVKHTNSRVMKIVMRRENIVVRLYCIAALYA